MKKRKFGTRGILMVTCMSIMIVSVIVTALIGLVSVNKIVTRQIIVPTYGKFTAE